MQSTVADLRALVAGIAEVPDEMPLAVLYDDDFGTSTALQIVGVEERYVGSGTHVVLSISAGQR